MLRLTNISKTFNPGTEDAKLALDNVSLHVRPGDFISIIGANGAGKSTLFGAIAGSFITDTGDIILDGEDITLSARIQALEADRQALSGPDARQRARHDH